ncbi:similar to stage IV sporulation protein [Oceanobacillus limi]|uniref:Similar to stage IV sporulation protein n=1 Tax=Oceanobacillus limi TaxID=930131 RepID=A0A1I0FUP4_9BACI|nr:sporulation protein YqfD [Oceanobacillus limi]SET61382.1 similar to stage IV sporulation protein [Oceanobacillus limi]
MKQIQGSYITGYVTLLVKGNMPELFFQECMNKGVTVWNIKKKNKHACSGNIKLQDIKHLKEIKRGKDYHISFIQKKGFPFLLSRFFRRKEIVIAMAMSILLIFLLSNVIWKVEIKGVPKDIEEKIDKQLKDYGVHPGAWTFTLDKPGEIQRNLTEDVPELLWVGVQKKGTTFFLEGVEKTIVEKKDVEGPRDLVATKKGVIKNMYVSKGLPKVEINDYVEPGDILVSGTLNEVEQNEEEEEEEEENKEKENRIVVASEGEIIANTWYNTEVTVPLKTNYELLTGEHENKYSIGFGDFQIPIWGFGTPDYEAIHREENENQFYFFKWKLPIRFIQTTLSEKTYHDMERSKEEAVQAGIRQAKQELQLKLGPDAEITSEKVLHESVESGKVKLSLHLTVEEDIAKAQPINQGD